MIISSRGVQLIDVVLLLFILMQQKRVDSEIVQRPSDKTAMVNELIYFNCSTSIRTIDERNIIWFHFPLDAGGDRKYVYDDGRIMTDYRNRCAIDTDLSSGKFNLLVLRLEPKDAGRYECRDDVHADIGASAELTVLGSDFVCDSDMGSGGVVGPTQCDRAIAPDEVQLTCRVTYNGTIAPQMLWRKHGDSSTSLKTECVTNYNRVTCNTTVTTNLHPNRSVYICELTTKGYHCSLEINNVLYAFANTTESEYLVGDEVTCVANASRQLRCSYIWYKDNTTEMSSHPTFKPNDPGLYRCQAQCAIRDDSCKLTTMVIKVSKVLDPGPNLQLWLWFLLLIPLIIGVIVAIRYRRSWLKLFRHDYRTEEAEVMPLTLRTNMLKDANKTEEEVAIRLHKEFLLEYVDPDSGLLDTLRENTILSEKEISELRKKSSVFERNSQLLDYILKKHQYSGLFAALQDSKQLHIVNYLKGNGEYNPEHGEEWPLTAKEILRLDANRTCLIDLLDLSDLLGRLHSSEVITKGQMDCVSSKRTSYSKHATLLNILRRCSLRYYQKTIECLYLSKQHHIAEVFQSGGVIVKVHARLSGNLNEVMTAEDELETTIASVLSGRPTSIAESSRIRELDQIRFIAAKSGQSIVLYIRCETMDELSSLRNLLTFGSLKDPVGQVFNQLLTRSKKVAVENIIRMNVKDFERMKAYFTANDQLEKEENATSSKSSAIKWEDEIKMATDEENAIERHREFLEEHMDSDFGLLETLHRNGTLSPTEILQIKRKRSFYERNSHLLYYIFEKREGELLLEVLRKEQLHVVNYLKANGEYKAQYGVEWPLTKEISILDDNQKSFIELLDFSGGLLYRLYSSNVITKRQRIFISSKSTPKSKNEAVLDILRRRRLRDYRQTIASLQQSRQFHIAEILEQAGGADCNTPSELLLMPQIDDHPGKYESYPLLNCVIKTEAARAKGSAITGVTILAEELFIVSELNSVVEVYHSKQLTFCRQWCIEVADPGGIVSCNRKQCLYIVGWRSPGSSRTILRVDRNGKLIAKWPVADSWSRLSVTRDSSVILTIQEDNKIVEYSSKGNLIREINLSSVASLSIKNPWHSVKLASGNFVVCCGLEYDDLHGVLIVDANGKVKKYGKLVGEDNEARLHQPVYLAVDRDEFVLVSDCKNSRVTLFDPSLEFQKDIIYQENHGLRFPSYFYLDESTSFLYVVENNYEDSDGQVLVFMLGL